MKIVKHLYVYLCFVALSVNAQETLTLEQAIEMALKNSYAINIVKAQQVDVAKNNNSYANAGFLPQVSLNAAENLSNNATHQKYNTGSEINKSGVKSTGINSGIALNWTVFDGMKMFATKSKLNELQALGEVNAKVQIENTLAIVINSFYDVVRQQEQIRAINEAIKIYEERIKIAKGKFDIGSSSKVDLLQAKVDLNTQKSLLLKQKTLLYNAKTLLQQALSAPPEKDFIINDSIVLKYQPTYNDLKTSLPKQNRSLMAAEKNLNTYKYILRENQSLYLPQISLNTSYNFTRTQNAVGFILLNQNLGLNTGVSASWNIFNSYKNRTLYQTNQILQYAAKLQYEQTQNIIETNLLKAWLTYQGALEAVDLEKENIILAKENVIIALERFRVGSSSSLELMVAQKSFEDAQSRFISARYDAKVVETELKRLNGELVK